MFLAVTGKPIAHSASPELHIAGLASCGVNGQSIRIIADCAEEAFSLCRDLGVKGCNVTSPFKESMYEFCDLKDEESELLSAVNTLLLKENSVEGFNTDVFGVAETLRPKIIGKQFNKKAVILGSGGAAKAASKALSELGIGFNIVSRNRAKAKLLAELFNSDYFEFKDKTANQAIAEAPLVVNCLATLERPFEHGLINSTQLILDSHYREKSEIAKEATEVGADLISGHEWLINQSRLSQKIFYQELPAFKPLQNAIINRKRKKSIALVGLMGSGKSSVAKLLAEKLSYQAVDIDEIVQKSSASTINQIFETKGEPFFRELEKENLLKIDFETPKVIACGGGIVIDQANRKFLSENFLVIWLWASADKLAERLEGNRSRPLLKDSDPKEKLKRLLSERAEKYFEVSDLLISTEKRSEQEVSERLYEELC